MRNGRTPESSEWGPNEPGSWEPCTGLSVYSAAYFDVTCGSERHPMCEIYL